MNLFILETFVSLDTLAPILDLISNRRKKTGILIINPLNNFSSFDLYKHIKKKINLQINLPLNHFAKIELFFLKSLLFLPNSFLLKTSKVWAYYYGKNFSSKKLIKKAFIDNKISSVTFEESLSKNLAAELYEVAEELKIKMIKIPSGLNTILLSSINDHFLRYCNYYIAPNKLRKVKENTKKSKILYLGSLRYRLSWIKKLRKIYKLKKNNNQRKIGLLNKLNSKEYPILQSIKRKLNKLKNKKIFESFKPRTRYPIQIFNLGLKSYLTGHVIYNTDIILCARSSSVIIEGILNNNKILYLNFINPHLKKTFLYKYKIIKKINNEKKILKFINNPSNKKEKKFTREITNKFLINFKKEERIESDYLKLY